MRPAPPWVDDPSVPLSARRILLSKKVLSSALRMNQFELKDFRPNDGADYLVRRLEVWLASCEVGRFEFRAPADWWQHLKERFAPAWFVARFPVRYRRQKIDVTALYPNIPLREEKEYFLCFQEVSPSDNPAAGP